MVAARNQLTSPPPWLMRQAVNLMARRETTADENPLRRFLAFLIGDSFAAGLAYGFRRVGSIARQIQYQAEHYNINLSVSPVESSPTVHVMGQWEHPDGQFDAVAGAEVELLEDSDVVVATTTNEFGIFTFHGIREGVYDLTIRKYNEEIHVVGFNAMMQTSPGGDIH
jgi:hypothetical protein